MTALLHVDTDFAGDPDDACALAYLLGRPDVEITGVTTNLDRGGERAACAAYVLSLVGRRVAVAAGAAASMTTGATYSSTAHDPRCWPADVAASLPTPRDATALLRASIERGARIVAIGALTNLAELELSRPGALHDVEVFFTGGWLQPLGAGWPPWGPSFDFNVQSDTRAAEIVAASGARLTLVSPAASVEAHVRARDLPRLRAAGALGALLATQTEVHATETTMDALAREHEALPRDLCNFHWDPVTAAVAAGWPGATVEPMRLRVERDGDVMRFVPDPRGRAFDLVTRIDAGALTAEWIASVERAATNA